ncbi:MAG: penicillin-insensitive murein endopeptidase [Myxococcota bacterium]
MQFPYSILVPLLAASLVSPEPARGPKTTADVPVVMARIAPAEPIPSANLTGDRPAPVGDMLDIPVQRIPHGPPRGRSRSVGLPQNGTLENAAFLSSSECLRFKQGTETRERWSSDAMIQLLKGAADHVAKTHPGAALTVGDLSLREGGPMHPHVSHQNGLDADVLWYALDLHHQVVQPDRMVRFRFDGKGRTGGVSYRFDDARNWALVSYLLDNPIAKVEYLFVASWLERRLLSYAKSIGVEEHVRKHAAEILWQSGGRHDDHIHMRIECPAEDVLCRNR